MSMDAEDFKEEFIENIMMEDIIQETPNERVSVKAEPLDYNASESEELQGVNDTGDLLSINESGLWDNESDEFPNQLKCEEIDIKEENLLTVIIPQDEDWGQNIHLKKKTKSDVKRYLCEHCGFSSNYHQILKRHLLTHRDCPELHCAFCSYKSKVRRNFLRHLLVHKPDSQVKWYNCPECSYRGKGSEKLKRHMLIHNNSQHTKLYTCEHEACNYRTNSLDNFRTHKITHIPKSQLKKVFSCDKCEYVAKFSGLLNRHMLLHRDPSESKWYSCQQCDYKATIAHYITRHMLVHKPASQAQLFRCEICKFASKTRGNLKRHMLLHADPKKIKLHKCNHPECSYEALQVFNLKEHILRHHRDISEVELHFCDLCEYKSKFATQITRHMRVFHKIEGVSSCRNRRK